MIAHEISPPQPTEYASYYGKYISLVGANPILAALDANARETVALLTGRKEADGELRYAPGKWSVEDVLGHITDSERVFAYRALRIARGDQTPMAGFEQDDWVNHGPFADCTLASLVAEFQSVRAATLGLFRNLRDDDWIRRGVANKNEVSVRALAYIIAGHELHHRKILQEKYFVS